jgi:hypothetical protein
MWAKPTLGHELTKANLIDRAISRIDGTALRRREPHVLDAAAF